VDIGNRLREVRQAKGLSQATIRERTGLTFAYISRVENGHSTPSLQAVEKWANALEVEVYQVFFVGHSQPEALVVPERTPIGPKERTLLGLYEQMPVDDRALLISFARELVKRKCKRA